MLKHWVAKAFGLLKHWLDFELCMPDLPPTQQKIKGIKYFEEWYLNSKWALTYVRIVYVMYIHTVPIYHRLAWLLWGMCLWNLTAAIRESTLMPHWLWPHFFFAGHKNDFLAILRWSCISRKIGEATKDKIGAILWLANFVCQLWLSHK